jgi:hypothetical protein
MRLADLGGAEGEGVPAAPARRRRETRRARGEEEDDDDAAAAATRRDAIGTLRVRVGVSLLLGRVSGGGGCCSRAG